MSEILECSIENQLTNKVSLDIKVMAPSVTSLNNDESFDQDFRMREYPSNMQPHSLEVGIASRLQQNVPNYMSLQESSQYLLKTEVNVTVKAMIKQEEVK